MCVPTWPPVTITSLAAEPPSARTLSPWRRCSAKRKPGWFGEQGMPWWSGCARSYTRRPRATASSREWAITFRWPERSYSEPVGGYHQATLVGFDLEAEDVSPRGTVIALDPVTLAVLKGRLEQIVEEMDATLYRSSFNPIIAEAHDACHGIYHSTTGDTLVQGTAGLPIFVGSMSFAVRAAIERADRDGG